MTESSLTLCRELNVSSIASSFYRKIGEKKKKSMEKNPGEDI